METICPVSGCKVFTRPEWINKKVSDTFIANFWIIGNSIIYSAPQGIADLEGVKNSISLKKKITQYLPDRKNPYIQIQDYAALKSSSRAARSCFIDNANKDNQLKSMIFCNLSTPLSIAVKIGNRFNTTNRMIHITKQYGDAVKKALALCHSQECSLDFFGFNIKGCFDKSNCSLSPVELMSDDAWKIETPEFSNHAVVIDRHILHSTTTGFLRSEHVPLISQMRYQILSDLPGNSSIDYIIINAGEIQGSTRSARFEMMRSLKDWNQRFPFKMYITYNANTFTRTAFHIAKPLMPFKIKVTNSLKSAMQLVRNDQKNPSVIKVVSEDTKVREITGEDINHLLASIGNLNWEIEGLNPSFDIPKNHPFFYIYQSMKMIKEELDDLFAHQKLTEKELRESERKYRQLFNHAPAGMFEIDLKKLRFINVNDVMCEYSGYTEAEFLSMNPLNLLTEESKKKYVKRFKDLTMGKNIPNTVEYKIIKKDNDELFVHLNNDYIYENGELIGARTVLHDITETKQVEAEKINAQKIAGEQKKLALVGKIAGKIAHDFNNILSIIMGNAELSLIDCKDSQARKSFELILQQTLRGKNLTKNLVAFAKDQEPKQEFFSVYGKIRLVLDLLKKDLEGIQVTTQDNEGVPDLLADPGMIEHMLVNFIQNSIHALSKTEHPKIDIRIYCLNDNLCLDIRDNGCGIPLDYHDKIYEPSFTLKGSKDITGSYESEIKGTGYGMSNIKKYIEQHNGDISFESQVGSGTRFTISLPIIKKELTSEEKIEIQEEITHFEKDILLIEDETDILDIQYRALSQPPCNHKVDIANNGQVAMDLFDRNEYDFISLDYILPGKINGMNVYNHIREKNKIIPILFISGNIEFLESIKMLKQKDSNIDHLSKPCQTKNYVRGINKLLEKTLAAH